MATYIIGDVQGCYDELQNLLELIQFNSSADRLGFVGDLVNRGPKSLETLRFIKNLNNPIVVLGNHDLHLLAVGYKTALENSDDTVESILNAPDKLEILDWLRHLPLAFHDEQLHYVVVHAGIPPHWSISQTLQYANEASQFLKGEQSHEFLHHMYGNKPETWNENLTGWDRLRYIVNALTRMRFCDENGKLELDENVIKSRDPQTFKPWFEWRDAPLDIIFGHWAALAGKTNKPGYYALDTGCVWGHQLTALRVEDKQLFYVNSLQPKHSK